MPLRLARAPFVKGGALFAQGWYRHAMEILNKPVCAEPRNQVAKDLRADNCEQLGYHYESPSLRNSFLAAAKELCDGRRILNHTSIGSRCHRLRNDRQSASHRVYPLMERDRFIDGHAAALCVSRNRRTLKAGMTKHDQSKGSWWYEQE